jgi:hypothetical protein
MSEAYIPEEQIPREPRTRRSQPVDLPLRQGQHYVAEHKVHLLNGTIATVNGHWADNPVREKQIHYPKSIEELDELGALDRLSYPERLRISQRIQTAHDRKEHEFRAGRSPNRPDDEAFRAAMAKLWPRRREFQPKE